MPMTTTTTPVILALDIGSSSVRCSAYAVSSLDDGEGKEEEEENRHQENHDDVSSSSRCGDSTILRKRSPIAKVQLAIPGACASRKLRLVQPNTGKILVSACLKAVDECMDEVLLEKLFQNKDAKTKKKSSSSSSSHDHDDDDDYDAASSSSYEVVAVGFSCFVMNLVGIDRHGEWVGEDASISYGCNTPAVAKEVRQLKRELGQETEQQLFQKTGAPIHTAYAVAQLRVLYKEQPSAVTDQIVSWQTLPSLCLRRWRWRRKQQQGGEDDDELGDDDDIPISYSEASWTGLLNYHSCQYETAMLDLLSKSCVKSLPKLADFDDDSWWTTRSHAQTSLSSSPLFLGPVYANRWPMLQNKTRFFLGIGDGACANVGSKCYWTPNRIACTVGTSAAARICLPLDIIRSTSSTSNNNHASSGANYCHASPLDIPSGLFCYRIDKSHVLVGGALTDGGSVVEWATQLLNLSTDDNDNDDNNAQGNKRTLRTCMDEVKTLLEADYDDHDSNNNNNNGKNMMVPAATVMAPFLSGERSTGYRSGATGAMLGLTRDTTPAHFLKASLEGVTLRILAIIQLLLQCIPNHVASRSGEEEGGGIQQERTIIMASGQALEVNGLWRQMIADSTGLNVVWDESTQEGTSRGVACLVAMALSVSSLPQERVVASAGDDKCLATTEKVSYLREDAVDQALVTISSPRGASVKRYWESAAAAQEDLIQALSPLYSKEAT